MPTPTSPAPALDAREGHRWGLDASTVRFFNSQWVPDQARWPDLSVSPLHAPDVSGLPGTLIVTAGHDPLRKESEAYARRLRDTGVGVELRREPGLIHNFHAAVRDLPSLRRGCGPGRG
jgi:acetyl esterase/lipase